MSLLGIDVGTTGCKAVAFSVEGAATGAFASVEQGVQEMVRLEDRAFDPDPVRQRLYSERCARCAVVAPAA